MYGLVNRFFRSLSLPMALGVLSSVCFIFALAVSFLSFWVLNGALPPNLSLVVAITSFFAALPLLVQCMVTIRGLKASRDDLKIARDELAERVAELDEATRALVDARVTLETRVERRTRELEAARSAAEQASRAKSAFLARMSHELRTPLNSIIGFAELLYNRKTLPPDNRMAHVEEYAGIIHQSGLHLLSLVSDLLDLAKIESGNIDLTIERVDLAMFMSDVEDMIGPQAREKDQKLVCLIDPGAGALEADRRALKQILLNLLSNAVKYSAPGKTIILSCTGIGEEIAFTVRDEGKGMAPEDIIRAMEPFTRLSDKETSGESGTGLGLYIVASLAEAQGGKLSLTSEVGKGTEARIVMPHRIPANRLSATRKARAERAAVA